MKKTNKIFSMAIASIVAFGCFTACNDSDSDSNINQNGAFTALVTYTGNLQHTLANGEHVTVSNFEYYDTDNTVAAAYTTAESKIPDDLFRSGQRMVITYIPVTGSTRYPQGEIDLKRYVVVPTATLTYDDHDKAIANNAEMTLYYENRQPSINRTGNYINMEIYMPYYEEREFSIVADESTLESSTPDLYISTTIKGNGGGVKSKTLASFDISSLWHDPSCTGVRIHINNNGGDQQKVFTFNK